MEDLKYITEEKNSVLEVIQDFAFLDCIFSTKRQLSRVEDKMVLAGPAFLGLSVFLYELSHDNCKFNNVVDAKYKSIISNLRTLFLKQVPTINSDIVKDTVEAMGTDLHNYVFDIIVTSDPQGKIYDVNFSSFNLDKLIEKNVQLIEELAMFPQNISKTVLNEFGDLYNSFVDSLNNSITEKIAEGYFVYNAESKSYATSLLFKNSTDLSDQEKYYILYRYSLIKAAYLLDDIPEVKLFLPSSIDEYLINTTFSAIKLRAMVICLLGDRGNDFQNEALKDTSLIKEINKAVAEVIDRPIFYKKNRDIRNNIHYAKTQKISNDDYAFVSTYQKRYFAAVLYVFEKYLFVDFGYKYKMALAFAKLRNWAEN